jgi:cell division initiation protein
VKVTPLDIRRKEFKRSMRGYSDEEVDIFLDEVADEFERLFQENMELHDRMQRLEEQIAGHAQMKDALEKTLISAQLQSDETRANARKESELILRDAELKARGIVNDSYGETQRVQQALIQLKHLEEDFRFKFRSLLEGHLKLLNDAPITAVGAETAAIERGDTPADGTPLLTTEPMPVATEPMPVAPEPVTALAEPAPVVPETSVVIEEPQALTQPDDEVPTEENEIGVVDLSAPAVSLAAPAVEEADATTLEVAEPVPETIEEEAPMRGFFFGRQMGDADDAFFASNAGEKDKNRDFEW